jgi:hypothetical protein
MDAAGAAVPWKEKASSYLYLGLLYFVTVGVLYLWGYWPSFGIDILEYISVAEVLKLMAYPVASTFIALAVGAAAGAYFPPLQRVLPPWGGQDTPAGRILHRFAPVLRVSYVLGTIALWAYGPVGKWHVLPVLIALPACFVAAREGILRSLLPHEADRTVVIFLLAALPPFAYGRGRLKAAAILDATDYYYLTAPAVDGLPTGDAHDPKNRIRYLGHVNDYVFLLLPDNATCVIARFDKTRGLQLKHFSASAGGATAGVAHTLIIMYAARSGAQAAHTTGNVPGEAQASRPSLRYTMPADGPGLRSAAFR